MHPIHLQSAIPLERGGKAAPSEAQLKQAAHEFEASLIEQLLKPMQSDPLFGNSSSGSDGDSFSNGLVEGGMDTVSSMSTQALAQAMANQGGLGIAALIIKKVHAEKSESTDSSTQKLLPLRGSATTLHTLEHQNLLPWSDVRRLPQK